MKNTLDHCLRSVICTWSLYCAGTGRAADVSADQDDVIKGCRCRKVKPSPSLLSKSSEAGAASSKPIYTIIRPIHTRPGTIE